ncbi:MAG: hypothetical protein GF315_11360 [candidate division Zixibacteria bacterium]|nr:hypothetical protein [candidate division Zixibacteria bacterium]
MVNKDLIETNDILKLSIIALTLGVLLSFLYPNGAEWQLPLPIFFAIVLEFFYYTLIVSLFDDSTDFMEHLFYAVGCFIFRLVSSMVFAAAITTAREIPFSLSLGLGVANYVPHVFASVLIAPWVLLTFIKEHHKDAIRAIKEKSRRKSQSTRKADTAAADKTDNRVLEPGAEHKDLRTGFAGILDYIVEYGGISGCLLLSKEGLIIEQRSALSDDIDKTAAYIAEIYNQNQRISSGLIRNEIERLEITAGSERIGIYSVMDILLVIISRNKTDELLRVRIVQALEMLKRTIAIKYRAKEQVVA